MQIWIFSKHPVFKYDFWEMTWYSNMNFWCFLFTPDNRYASFLYCMHAKYIFSTARKYGSLFSHQQAAAAWRPFWSSVPSPVCHRLPSRTSTRPAPHTPAIECTRECYETGHLFLCFYFLAYWGDNLHCFSGSDMILELKEKDWQQL